MAKEGWEECWMEEPNSSRTYHTGTRSSRVLCTQGTVHELTDPFISIRTIVLYCIASLRVCELVLTRSDSCDVYSSETQDNGGKGPATDPTPMISTLRRLGTRISTVTDSSWLKLIGVQLPSSSSVAGAFLPVVLSFLRVDFTTMGIVLHCIERMNNCTHVRTYIHDKWQQ